MKLFSLILILCSSYSFAQSFDLNEALKQGEKLDSYSERINYYSHSFLERAYDGGPLGEGAQGRYDQDPLFSFDQFDCTTYVETVIALAKSGSARDFIHNLKEIRYKHGVTRYTERNHFISLDWIENNSNLLKDITADISLDDTSTAETIIKKKAWYQSKKESDLKLKIKLSPRATQERLVEFQNEGQRYDQYDVETSYVPLTKFFIDGEVNEEMLRAIPQGSIISMVRPNWELSDVIGTNLNISHQGFAIWKKGELLLRHASTKGSVREVSFVDYFKNYINSKTLKGFNVLQLY